MRALVAIGVVLLVLWAVLWIGFRIMSGLIHLIIVVAIILLVVGLVRRGAGALGDRVRGPRGSQEPRGPDGPHGPV
jgi:hypothetical protein